MPDRFGRILLSKVEIRARKKSFKGTRAPQPTTFRTKNIDNEVPVPTIGVPNPFGMGASAFEPETELFDPGVDDPLLKGYDDAFNAVQRSRAEERQATVGVTEFTAGEGVDVPKSTKNGGTLIRADGKAASVIAAAQSMLGKPYIWGGTTTRGVDCSGLLYLAFNQAGIKMPRYVASQYGKMGQGISQAEARPGDIVYFDNAGSVDHVGIYLGDNKFIQAPTTGDVVKVSTVWNGAQFRRIMDDSFFGEQAAPPGQKPVLSYGGKAANKMLGIASPVNIFGGR